jgi:DNA/RNA-binding domain of Phe-tRNA-synthetase-like protein
MTDVVVLEEVLAGAYVDAAVFALRPDYRVLMLAVDGLVTGPSDQDSDALLQAAEAAARQALTARAVDELPHVAAWREAYRAFGAKPQRTRNSVEALLRRAGSGLPRVNRLTDTYNAISVLHQIPLGGEDLRRYAGSPRLIRATGTEPFDTVADGATAVERPDAGEVVWCDEAGGDVPTLELAPGPPYPARRGHHDGAVHSRRARPHDRRGASRRRRRPGFPPGAARTRRPSSSPPDIRWL